MKFDIGLKQWATGRQEEFLNAYLKHGSIRAAASALGLHHSTVQRSLDSLKAKAIMQGYSPEHGFTQTVPEGFKAKRVSTLFDAKGNIKNQWVIGTADEAFREAALKEAVRAFYE